MTFHVGQKVACVRAGPWRALDGDLNNVLLFPQKGRVYEIDLIDLYQGYTFLGLAGLPAECVWDADLFRPVIERQTDISIFTSLLTPSPARTKELVD
jgi:hypothetical protein